MKLHASPGKNYFLCHRCGYSNESNIRCINCDSWNLIQLGITGEVVANYIKKTLRLKSKLFNSDICKNSKQIEEFLSDIKPKDIIISTNKILGFSLSDTFGLTVAIGLDGLMAIPDFRTEEKIFNIQIQLLEMAKNKFIIQTKDSSINAIDLFHKRKINEFIREELKLRHKLKWPPYVTLIKINAFGTKKEVISSMQILVNELKDYKIRVFRAFTNPQKGKFALSALIKIENANWPDEKLIEILEYLPGNMEYIVNPESAI